MSLSTMQQFKHRPLCQWFVKELLVRQIPSAPVRRFKLIPATQYDTPSSKRFKIPHVLIAYWEIIPLFLVTSFSIGLVVLATVWTVNNKVDVQWAPKSNRNISHTMDLRDPTVHKFIIINQKYAPWPEMQDVLNKMKAKEQYDLSRRDSGSVQTCSFAASKQIGTGAAAAML